MPSFVLSLALLLLVVLMLLAVSNRELIALTFLGFSTAALPLSIWIVGAIALGFLLGLWILLLFRFGAVGLGSGNAFPSRRRANYGPEDFAVVDEQLSESRDRYDDGRYSDNRYDDIYAQGQYQSDVTTSQDGYQSDSTARDYPAEGQSTRYGSDDYRPAERYETDRYGRGTDDYGAEQQPYSDRSDSQPPQDRFSAASGYESANAASSDNQSQNRPRQTDASQTTLQSNSAADPTIPADWDDQYREDWTQDELVAEPILRNEGAAPKLKRWLNQSGEGRSKSNVGGLSGAAEYGEDERRGGQSGEAGAGGRSPEPLGEATDWQGAAQGDRYGGSAYERNQAQGDVYDADYRVVRQPESNPEPRKAPEPLPRRETSTDSTAKESEGDRPKSEWDIESDLDW